MKISGRARAGPPGGVLRRDGRGPARAVHRRTSSRSLEVTAAKVADWSAPPGPARPAPAGHRHRDKLPPPPIRRRCDSCFRYGLPSHFEYEAGRAALANILTAAACRARAAQRAGGGGRRRERAMRDEGASAPQPPPCEPTLIGPERYCDGEKAGGPLLQKNSKRVRHDQHARFPEQIFPRKISRAGFPARESQLHGRATTSD